MTAQPRILLVEECLVDERGHYAGLVGGFAAWLERQGLAVEVWAHAAVTPRLMPPGVTLRAVFRENWIEALFRRGRVGRLGLVFSHNVAFFCALRRAGLGRRWDLVLALDTNIFQLAAWRVWLALAPRSTRLALVTIRAPWLGDYGPEGTLAFKPQARLYRWVWGTFAGEVRSGRCRLAADTEANSRALAAFAGLPFVPLALPRADSLLAHIGAPPPAAAGRRLGFVGRPTREKGFDRFLAAVEQCVREGRAPGLRFVVQWQEAPDASAEDLDRLRAVQAIAPERIEIVEGVLDEPAYAALLGSLHGLVLPYVRGAYAGRGSSLATDMLCSDRPYICTAGTWMAEQMWARGAGLECDETVAGLATALDRFDREYPRLAEAAVARGPAARAYFSWGRLFQQLAPDLERALPLRPRAPAGACISAVAPV